MMTDTYETLQTLLEEILYDHRCVDCKRYLCCGATVFHDVNCWSQVLKENVSWDMIAGIRNYRLEVLNGSMLAWEEYAFEMFDYYKHVKEERMFRPHTYGLYVRCFSCLYCMPSTDRTIACKAAYHKHF